jgi:HAD superfamily hydrolase (TIGR01458 family)
MAGGVLLDIDGVLTVSWEALPGAAEALRWLEGRSIDFRLVTNTSSKSRHQIATLLADAGMPVPSEQILTAVNSAARHLVENYPGVRCFVVNDGDLRADLDGVEVVGTAAAAEAGVVLLGGAGPGVGYVELDAAFRLALDGAPVLALHRNTRYQTADGPALDMGAFIVGLEAAADIEVTVMGKPAAPFFEAALAAIGVDAEDALMVGDDIGSDVLGAQAMGMTGVLVKTGKFRPSDLEGGNGGGRDRPDHVIDSIADLPELLEGDDRT